MREKPTLTVMSADGTVGVLIGQTEYTYMVDAALFPELKRLFKHKPWAAVNLLKTKAYHCEKE